MPSESFGSYTHSKDKYLCVLFFPWGWGWVGNKCPLLLFIQNVIKKHVFAFIFCFSFYLQSRFTITLPRELSFHKCLIVTVRGTNRVGLVSLVTADVMDCEAVGPTLVVPRVVLDVVGRTAEGQ